MTEEVHDVAVVVRLRCFVMDPCSEPEGAGGGEAPTPPPAAPPEPPTDFLARHSTAAKVAPWDPSQPTPAGAVRVRCVQCLGVGVTPAAQMPPDIEIDTSNGDYLAVCATCAVNYNPVRRRRRGRRR